MANLRLSRAQIAQIVGNDPEAIKQFEKLFSVNQDYFVSGTVDAGLVEAGNALSVATNAAGGVALLDSRVTALELQPPVVAVAVSEGGGVTTGGSFVMDDGTATAGGGFLLDEGGA